MQNPESALENATHKILWDFKMQANDLIPAKRPYLVIVNKKQKIYSLVDFAITADNRVKTKENEMGEKYLDLARERKKAMEYESDGDTSSSWCT